MRLANPPGGGWERKARGGALAAIVITLPLIMLALAAYSSRALTEMEMTIQGSHRARTLYIAHAGLQKAGRAFLDDNAYRGSATDVPYGGGTYSYTVVGDEVISELENRVRVVVSATYPDASLGDTEMELTVIISLMGRFVIDHAVAAWGRIIMNGGAEIGDAANKDNSVYSGNLDPATEHESIYGGGSTQIYGTAELATSVTQTSINPLDPGPIEYGVDAMTFPTYSLLPLKTKAQNNLSNPQYPTGAHFTMDKVFDGETLTGVIFCEGSVVVKGNTTIDQGCIIQNANAGFTISGTLTHTSYDDPMLGAPNLAFLKTGGNVLSFSPAAIVSVQGYIFSTDRVIFDADGFIRGGIICENDVELGGNGTVYFERIEATDLAQEVNLTQDGWLEIVSWVEVAEY